ncbi:hypothetical protein FLONG3_7438 [Fusarium longipes]|uniref:Uncharacterized protein n=1 Tax=Fusarium longipes TaxID=694270 RepID=A0A395SE77_9HYPO|nr:hypothetical protein FLONG3_7438 [Fusarium longipes]
MKRSVEKPMDASTQKVPTETSPSLVGQEGPFPGPDNQSKMKRSVERPAELSTHKIDEGTTKEEPESPTRWLTDVESDGPLLHHSFWGFVCPRFGTRDLVQKSFIGIYSNKTNEAGRCQSIRLIIVLASEVDFNCKCDVGAIGAGAQHSQDEWWKDKDPQAFNTYIAFVVPPSFDMAYILSRSNINTREIMTLASVVMILIVSGARWARPAFSASQR